MAIDQGQDVRQGVAAACNLPAGAGEESLRRSLGDCMAAVRRYAFILCGAWDEAEDLAQEALLRAWRGRAGFDGRAAPQTWVFSIARNCWRDRLRRKRAGPQVEPMSESPTFVASSSSPMAAAELAELAEAVRGAVRRLPPEQAEAVALRESGDLTFRQIGQLLGVPAATVKSRVRYALLHLADELRRFGPEAQS